MRIALTSPARRVAVDDVHSATIAVGAEILHAPRVWPGYHPGYVGVFLHDLDGNDIEAVHHTFTAPAG